MASAAHTEKEIPRESVADSTIALLRDPYHFISKRCRAHGADLFETRLQLQKTICMTGKKAAEVFYDGDRFKRDGAAPGLLKKTLFGEGGVQTLDDSAHLQRKSLFIDLLTPESVAALARVSEAGWEEAAMRWEAREHIVLYDEARYLLTKAVCAWAGVPLTETDVTRRTDELTALFEYAGSVSAKHWRSRRARKSAEKWAAAIVQKARGGELAPPSDSGLARIAYHRDEQGELLDLQVAAVELLNLLRPTVAVAVYIAFVALALHRFPECRAKIASRQHGYTKLFVEEVRRYYPFFPAVIARVRREFAWRGYRFPEGRTVLLDLYGTNHDPREWENPEEFRPERFSGRAQCPFSFMPQGGGEASTGHRCPGDGVATALMSVAAEFLVHRLDYALPEQDMSVDGSILPALPTSRIVMSYIRLRLS